MSTKYLGGENILRAAYDPASESLRTTAVASFVGGTVDVSISHLTDSIKIGDGVDLLAVNTDGSINVNVSPLTNPLIYNVVTVLSGTEYSQALPSSTKEIKIKARGNAKLQITYTLGDSGSNFITIFPGDVYVQTGTNLVGKTIYFQSTKPGEVVEIITWT